MVLPEVGVLGRPNRVQIIVYMFSYFYLTLKSYSKYAPPKKGLWSNKSRKHYKFYQSHKDSEGIFA
jgi:hypothetical protein